MEATLVQSEYEIQRDKPMPSKNHAIVQSNLLFNVRLKYGQRYAVLSEINLDLPIRERVPDLAIYDSVSFTPGNDEIRMTEPPLTVVEILSPQQSITDLMVKRGEYFAAGVQSYWLVVPDLLTVYVFYTPDDYDVFVKKETLRDKKLDLELSLADVFK